MSQALKVLVPTDFSDFSNKAIDTAIELCSKIGGDVTILHVIDYSGYVLALDNTMLNTITLNQMYDDLQKEAEKHLDEITAKLKNENVKIDCKITSGLPADEIIEASKETQCDVIVMGTKGANNIADELLGTLTDKIVRKAHCPVLAVHKNIKKFAPKKTAIISSFKEDLGPDTQKVLKLIKLLNSSIELTRINTVADFENTKYTDKIMNDFSKKWDIKEKARIVYNHEHFETGLYQYAQSADVDLIVMATHGRRGLNHIYHGGSKTEDVIKRIDIPVLSFRIS